MLDRLEATVSAIRRRQFNALKAEVPTAFEGHQQRMSTAMLTGLAVFQHLNDDSVKLSELMSECIALAERDPQFAFLNAIPEGPILSMSRALALEHGIFKTETPEVARLSLLIALYTIILDGLLDEARGTLRPIQHWLDQIMDPMCWDSLDLIVHPDSTGHPVTDILVWVTTEAIHEVTRQHGWRHDPFIRSQFALATQAAYRSEVASTSCRITDGQSSLEQVRERILAKSIDPIWAGSLSTFCVHGWPEGLGSEEFAGLAQSIGAFGGWLDDITDLAIDIRADRWSMALIEIHQAAVQLLPQLAGEDPRIAMIEILPMSLIAERLAFLGVERLRLVRAGLARLGFDEDDLLPVLADVATVSLTSGLHESVR